MRLGFVVTTYWDYQNLERCLASVRGVYHDEPIAVIDDGSGVAALESLVERRGVTLERGKHWYRSDIGAWLHRYLRAGLALDCDVIVKIDPDTRIHRAFKALPDAPAFGFQFPCWFGTYLHGGCKAMTRPTAETVAGIIQAFADAIPEQTRQKIKRYDGGLPEDYVLSMCLLELGIETAPWPDVSIFPHRDGRGFAATHGHKPPLVAYER